MTEQQTTPTSEILHKAADLIEERGWIAGEGWPTAGDATDAPLCLEGGLLAAMSITLPRTPSEKEESRAEVLDAFWQCPAHNAVMAYLSTDTRWGARVGLLRTGNAHAYDWNDGQHRTASEVIEVLRAAALIEAAKENEAAPVEVSS